MTPFEQALAEYARAFAKYYYRNVEMPELKAELDALRAALVAMATRGTVPRVPTPEMCAAGFVVSEAEHDPGGVWRAMYDAALAQPSDAGKEKL